MPHKLLSMWIWLIKAKKIFTRKMCKIGRMLTGGCGLIKLDKRLSDLRTVQPISKKCFLDKLRPATHAVPPLFCFLFIPFRLLKEHSETISK